MPESRVDNVKDSDSHNGCDDAGYHGNMKTYTRTHGSMIQQSHSRLFPFFSYAHQTAPCIV